MKGTKGQILYLDFDGVLHHEGVWYHPRVGPYFPAYVPEKYKLFAHIELLAKLLEPYPSVSIVLSTSWSKQYGLARAAKNLGYKLRHRVIGSTYNVRMNEQNFLNKPRGVQVVADLLRRKPAAWVALDDDYNGWPTDHLQNYVKTHPAEGISDPRVQAQIKEIFLEKFGK